MEVPVMAGQEFYRRTSPSGTIFYFLHVGDSNLSLRAQRFASYPSTCNTLVRLVQVGIVGPALLFGLVELARAVMSGLVTNQVADYRIS